MSCKIPRGKLTRVVLAICFISTPMFIFGPMETNAQCACAGGSTKSEIQSSRSASEELQAAEVVFIGEAIENKKIELPSPNREGTSHEYELTFKVKRAWKKAIDEIVKVRESGPCLLGFKKGNEVLVYAFADEDRL